MSDQNKEFETTRQDEWSGTPFQGWKSDENEENGARGEAQQVETEESLPAQEEVGDVPEVGATEPVDVEATAAQAQESEPAEESAEPAASQPSTPHEHLAVGQPVDYNRTFRSLTEGDVVSGVVVHIDKEGVLVDVGTKSEGIIRPNELSRESNLAPEDVVAVGDSIDVYVMQSENQDGNLVLSKKRADFERAWERVEEILRSGKVLSAMVTDRVKGGLVVDLGIRGFVPASHVGSGKIKNLDKYVGQSLPLKVIEVDRERRKVVLSNRLAVEEDREKQKAETIGTLAEGQIRPGIVRRITDYGAFVDLGGIDGLLHISEMSWTRIKHPSDVVKVGDKIQVMVLKLDLDRGKVSLGLRQILPDPWAEIEHKYRVGDVIKGQVSRLVPFGAFVQLDGGIEGIIPNSELATRRVNKPEDVVTVGQEVEIKVVDLRPDERRMTLSLRQLQQQQERDRDRAEMSSYSYTREEPRTTIGDLVGDMMMREARDQKRERKRRLREAEERVEEEEAIEEAVAEAISPTVEPEAEQQPTAEFAPEVQEEPESEAQAETEEEAVAEAPTEVVEAVEVSAEPTEEVESEELPTPPIAEAEASDETSEEKKEE